MAEYQLRRVVWVLTWCREGSESLPHPAAKEGAKRVARFADDKGPWRPGATKNGCHITTDTSASVKLYVTSRPKAVVLARSEEHARVLLSTRTSSRRFSGSITEIPTGTPRIVFPVPKEQSDRKG